MSKVKGKNGNRKRDLKIRPENVSSSHIEIGKIYDLGIQACEAKDSLKVRNVIDTLKGLLNFQRKEVASGFYRLYDFCLQFVNNNRFDKARDIFYELQQSWNVAIVTIPNYTHNSKILRNDKFKHGTIKP